MRTDPLTPVRRDYKRGEAGARSVLQLLNPWVPTQRMSGEE